MSTAHPAKFSDAILDEIAAVVGCNRVLDPFAGTGRIHELGDRLTGIGLTTVGVELEPEWAACDQLTIVGNALHLPFDDFTFDAIATSPAYGNRLADHHEARDGSVRHSYRHDLGRPLHPDNAGALQWGPRYRAFHESAWAEAIRVLRPGGRFVLNVSDHIRDGRLVPVVAWHASVLITLGLHRVVDLEVGTRRLRYGANRDRPSAEHVLVFEVPDR